MDRYAEQETAFEDDVPKNPMSKFVKSGSLLRSRDSQLHTIFDCHCQFRADQNQKIAGRQV